jgi:hypothetical protein
MKSSKKITRVQLNTTNLKDELIIIGIVSSDPDYKLSLSLNKKFRISLKNSLPLKLNVSGKQDLAFSRFSDTGRSPDIIYNLISNRSGKDYLIKNLKNIDYIFQIHNADYEIDIKTISASLREIESVNAVFNIDINNFRDKNLQYLIL